MMMTWSQVTVVDEIITLEVAGEVIHSTVTEEEMWGWIAVNLQDVEFWPEGDRETSH